MQDLSEERTKEIMDNCQGKIIAVIGDVMLDRYFWGSVSRISPEAPVPVIDIENETFHLGGAANVANNLKSLGAEPLLCGVIGDDSTGRIFTSISETNGIVSEGLFIDSSRPTTVKTRIIGNNQQIARLDREVRKKIETKAEDYIVNILSEKKILAGIIFEDYNKGTITESLIAKVLAFAAVNNIPVFVDPKFDNFFAYKGVTVFKPNRKEAQTALGVDLKSEDNVLFAGKMLLEKLNCENVLLTLGADGMMLFEANGTISSVPTRARHVADVSGAGDTAIATLAAAISAGASIRESASLANFAAGHVCEEPGIVSITKTALVNTVVKNHTKPGEIKIMS